MNPDTLMQSLQTGFRVTIGAASSAIESLQDPQKREENLQTFQQQDWNAVVEKLAAKGEVTEQEARNFVDSLMGQTSGGTTTASTSTSANAPTTAAPTGTEAELQDLTAQVATLRRELERLREQDARS
ncbi:hypothetical protein [Baaleninema simplex]|uniref:hypothetical protein n=1 Tax=Baaleninema simplex TaxID=2862350 RepID=UPI00034AB576|nr:hypothetical protein [Baaleninema simplex]